MTRRCPHILSTGRRCRHRVADPQRPDCGQHAAITMDYAAGEPAVDERGCRLWESAPGAWRCLVHNRDDPVWMVAEAMGARPPCFIPAPYTVRKKAAAHQPINPTTARILSTDPDPRVRGWLAANPSCPADVLGQLARDSTTTVSRRVASNESTSGATLEYLAHHPDGDVRQRVARNPHAPASALRVLAQDSDEWVRRHVAAHKSTPADALRSLSDDPSLLVRTYLASSSRTPGDLLLHLAKDSSQRVRESVAKNKRTPPAALVYLAEHGDPFVKLLVLQHPKATRSIAQQLQQDLHPMVQERAQRRRWLWWLARAEPQ